MSETKQNYDEKPSYSALRSIGHWLSSLGHGASDGKQGLMNHEAAVYRH